MSERTSGAGTSSVCGTANMARNTSHLHECIQDSCVMHMQKLIFATNLAASKHLWA